VIIKKITFQLNEKDNNDNYSFLKAIEHNILEKKIFEINAKRNDRNYS